MRKVKFIVPLPDVFYYDWHLLPQINNFSKYGYDEDTHYLVGVFNNNASENIRKMADSPKIKSKFHFYMDERTEQERAYSASLKPFLMYKYFQQHPWEKDCAYVYLDPDVIYLDKFDFTPFLDDDIWYGSDVGSYLDSNYIKQKGGDELLNEFCEQAGISPELVIANDKNCIGAQYLTKNNTPEFWKEVYQKSSKCYVYLNSRRDYFFKPEMTYWLQIWTNEMWLTIWQLWLNGVETKHTNEWCFHWGNHFQKDKTHKIFHNAGVADPNEQFHFSKTAYQVSPFNKDIPTSQESLSYEYVKEIKEAEVAFPDLIW